ncbi:hypothetical protein [Microbacterium sp. LRZ72]|uniref:hypothetical protein n=1 Tax=Microbacterium sp. LRZ72 TaxID=2942481 RepID=UPI0029C0F949|nr:hypothetical protein [Microbacterium sp. LRZ72]
MAMPRIARLMRRGLEVREGKRAYRAHNKYINWVGSADLGYLVTADDDIFYPRSWLEELWAAFVEGGRMQAVGHWVRCPSLIGLDFAPFSTWKDVTDQSACIGRFTFGVSGVIFPSALRQELARSGTAFLERAPLADDIWISWCALRSGVEVRQCRRRSATQLVVPLTQGHQLAQENVLREQNDRQLATTYNEADRKALRGISDGSPTHSARVTSLGATQSHTATEDDDIND